MVIAPEVESGEPYGLSADIWALGNCFTRLITKIAHEGDIES